MKNAIRNRSPPKKTDRAELVTQLATVNKADETAVTAYCRAWSLYVEADKVVQQYGMMMVSKKTGSFYQSPYLNVMTAAMMTAFAAELGMTPVSRPRLKTGPAEERDDMMNLLERMGRGRN